jgi:predicted NBD/HSP70 family sugar kinase
MTGLAFHPPRRYSVTPMQMNSLLDIEVGAKPELDPDHLPAVLWNRAYRKRTAADPDSTVLRLAIARPDGTCFVHETAILPHQGENIALNGRYVERLVKSLLWLRGGSRIHVGGSEPIAELLRDAYSPGGERSFDDSIIGSKMFGEGLSVISSGIDEVPEASSAAVALGRNLDGCRIGFDLGGSDRKCAALIDGKVVYSQEVAWNPYFETDPAYHYRGIDETLRLAADRLPRVDAIGGSAAGVYVNNEVRVASLFRGVSPEDFEKNVRRIFFRLKDAWGGVPFEVVNDGEVTALAGSMSLGGGGLLGISMGTSLAAGYCDPEGKITAGINELAFAPIDYRENAPIDEWSEDLGCGVQYFSQQGVARLAPLAGIELPETMPLAERLVEVQQRMAAGDEAAARIYRTIGTCFGYSIAHYAEFYEIEHLLILGRVTSGEGGDVILGTAEELLRDEFPDLAEKIDITTPNEQDKRHGQAIAAASLPSIG